MGRAGGEPARARGDAGVLPLPPPRAQVAADDDRLKPVTLTALVLCATTLSTAIPALAAQEAGSRIDDGSPRFEFHSDFWLNLHHFLHSRAGARAGAPNSGRAALAAAPADTAGAGSLSPVERRGWAAALEHYERHVARRDLLFDAGLGALKTRLTGLAGATPSSDLEIDPELARALETAAPAYRRAWWAAHDRANRRWVERLLPLLAAHEDALAPRLAHVLGTFWPGSAVRVDVSAYANWAGAYTTLYPTHVVISSTAPGNDGSLALETLFHETSHALVERAGRSLRRAAEAAGVPEPEGLWHSVLFYTVGELVRERIPGHVPYAEAFGLWERGDRPREMAALRDHWWPWLAGESSFDEAIRRLAASSD